MNNSLGGWLSYSNSQCSEEKVANAGAVAAVCTSVFVVASVVDIGGTVCTSVFVVASVVDIGSCVVVPSAKKELTVLHSPF